MPRDIARASIDDDLGILNSDVLLSPKKRELLTKRFIAELEKLSHDPEHLQFAEECHRLCRAPHQDEASESEISPDVKSRFVIKRNCECMGG